MRTAARAAGFAVLLLLTACGDGVGPTPGPGPNPDPDPVPDPDAELVWPLSGDAGTDGDSIHSPYGPRWIGSYDFHAGIDLPANLGRPVRAVMAGEVAQVRTWDGHSAGAGNAILIHHADGRSTSYLHLHTTGVVAGQRVEAGDVIGTVGRTGATYPHLHLGYMLELPGNTVDERRSRNPLELMPHTAAPSLSDPDFTDTGAVRLTLPLRSMTVRSISLAGGSGQRVLDYYRVVSRGAVPRNERVQDGVHVSADAPVAGRFTLTLRPDPADFSVERVVVVDIHGDTILDRTH